MPDAATPAGPAEPLDLDEPARATTLGGAAGPLSGAPAPAPRGPGRARRPRWRTAALALALTAVVALTTWQRTSAVDAARLRQHQEAALAVLVAGGGLLVGQAPDAGDYNARATLELDVVNAGPRPVQLLRVVPGEAADRMTSDVTDARTIAPATVERVVVAGPVSCPLRTLARSRTVRLVVRTADGERHDLVLGSPPGWTLGLRRTCALPAGAAPL